MATPLGLGAAIYLSEYARPRVRKTIKPILEVLAGRARRSSSATSRSPSSRRRPAGPASPRHQHLQRARRRDHHGLHDPADDRVRRRGRDVGRARSRCARAPTGSAPPSSRSRLRVVFPAALSGIVAAIVLGVSRAVGETMIVLVAAGQAASNSLDPREAHLSLASFIGSTAGGDTPTGSIEYKTIFAVGMLLFVITLAHEPDRDPLRAEVQAGVRMSAHGGVIAPPSTEPARQGRGLPPGAAVLPRRRRSCCSPCSLYDVAADGVGHLDWHFITNFTSIDAGQGRRQVGDLGDDLADGRLHASSSCRWAWPPPSTSRSTRTTRAGGTGWSRSNIQNLASVPSVVYGILGLAFLVRGPLSLGPGGPGRRATLGLLVLPVVIIAGARGDPGRAALDPRGLAGPRRHAVADHPAPGAAGLDPRHRDRRDPRPLAGDRRDGAADRGRRRHGGRLQPRRASTRASPRFRSRSSTGSRAPPTTSTTTSRSRRRRSWSS